jgi:hypothetical protein
MIIKRPFVYNIWLIVIAPRYYTKTNLCPAYTIAVALHPTMKSAYFHEK